MTRRRDILITAISVAVGILAVFSLALAVSLVSANRIYAVQIKSCERENDIRVEINERAGKLTDLRDAIRGHLEDRLSGDPALVAEGRAGLLRGIDRLARVQPGSVPILDCEAAIDRPRLLP